MFVASVGEEELGNLRGVKALFRDNKDIDGFISIDGLGVTRIVNQGTGSHRYEMIFKGPGGHSFQEFGLPSATHALGRAVAKISELQTPSDPKTTFTVGTVSGGTSVNAIAAEARMAIEFDRRTVETRSEASRSGEGRSR
jgi:acetylornithine deacetylase/succinyl-diaminopimelate desuccinylase-like protein